MTYYDSGFVNFGSGIFNKFQPILTASLVLSLYVLPSLAIADDDLAEITVKARRVANELPASGFRTAATELRFDPLTELQSRGLAEGQSDVTVRGGLFENTGFKLGAVTIMDPQTGHYVAELPVDPSFLTSPTIHKGIDSAVDGFNSAIATISYGFPQLQDGGRVAVGSGSDSLNHQALRYAKTSRNSAGNNIGVALSFARSAGDGSVQFGDHEFSRLNVQLQQSTDNSQTDIILAYQDKFYGWPGAYTGFATLPEIDDTQTSFVFANHRLETALGWFEIAGYYRQLEDDYDFNRTTSESGAPGSFEHESRVVAVGFQGLAARGRFAWRYGGQVTSDELVRSTDLTNGPFNRRTYATLSIAPTIETELANGNVLAYRVGATVDYSNRDSNAVAPLLGVELITSRVGGETRYVLEYASTSQLPGYTVLKSNTTGLFGGNPLLGREKSKQLSISIERNYENYTSSVTLFAREDDNLVDWTYSTGSPFARQANAVDIDVVGLEAFMIRHWNVVDIVAGITLLDKDADYGNESVDASFYALNFAKLRATFAITYRFLEQFDLRIDTEYRNQQDNPLRVGGASTLLASLSIAWQSDAVEGLDATLIVDNATNSEYQPFPGTPASGRQLSLTVSYGW